MKTITADQIPVADNPHGVDVRHLYSNPHVAVSQITLQPGEVVNPHQPPVDVFFYILEGTPTFEIDREITEVVANTLIPSGSGHMHGVRNESAGVVRLLVVKTPNPRA